MKKIFYVSMLAILVMSVPCLVNATDIPSLGSVQGIVSDASTGSPIAGASVAGYGLNNTSNYTHTDSTGFYILNGLSAGSARVYAGYSGYSEGRDAIVVIANDTVEADFALVPIPPPPPPAIGSVQGTVTDTSTGSPIVGASVAGYGSSNSPSSYTHTDSTGYYILNGLSAGSTRVYAGYSGYSEGRDAVVVIANDTVEADFALVPIPPPPPPPPPPGSGSISGTVTDASTGSPIAGANVAVTFYGNHDASQNSGAKTITDSNGNYILTGVSAGSTVVYVSAQGYSLSYQKVNVPSNDTVVVNFSLTAIVQPTKGAVTGTVTDSDSGLPIAGAYVYARPTSDSEISGQYSGHDCDGDQYGVTDSTGVYLLPRLYAGAYNVTASKDGYQSGTQVVTITGNSTTTTDFALTAAVVTSGSIIGTVTDASTGNPIVGAFVFVSIDVENWYGKLNKIKAQTDSTGSYELDGVPAGDRVVKAVSIGYLYGSQSVTVVANDTITVDFALVPKAPKATGTITGTVSDASTGLPLAGAKVFVREGVYDLSVGSGYGFVNTTTDANGNYSVTGISTGTRYVVSFDSGYHSSEQQATVLANQTTEVDFTLSPYGNNTSSVSIHIVQKSREGTRYANVPVTNATVFVPVNDQVLPTSSWDNHWTQSNGSGDAQISNIPSGSQMVVVLKDGYESHLVNTSLNGGTSSITIELTPSSK